MAYASYNKEQAVIHLNKRVSMENVTRVAASFGLKVGHHFKNKHQWDVANAEGLVASLINENLVVLSNKVTPKDKKMAMDFVSALLDA